MVMELHEEEETGGNGDSPAVIFYRVRLLEKALHELIQGMESGPVHAMVQAERSLLKYRPGYAAAQQNQFQLNQCRTAHFHFGPDSFRPRSSAQHSGNIQICHMCSGKVHIGLFILPAFTPKFSGSTARLIHGVDIDTRNLD